MKKTSAKKIATVSGIFCLAGMLAILALWETKKSDPFQQYMPHSNDFSSMWWLDGFPGAVEGAPWHRSIRTGHFGFVLDTDRMTVPHFGPIDPRTEVRELPPAELDLAISVDGTRYRCKQGGAWARHEGPRLIESGELFQRADVTDLKFVSDEGKVLNAEARFETTAWSDQLGLVLSARPGKQSIPAGELSFGRVRGGYGLTEDHSLELEPFTLPKTFTFEFWAFLPEDYQVSDRAPWLFCKNRNEASDGNVGIMILRGNRPQARMNLGGRKENTFVTEVASVRPLATESWNHLAVSYDGSTMRLYANGAIAAELKIDREHVPVPGGLSFGRREDNFGDGYKLRGAVDEVRIYDRALSLEELRLHYVKPEADRPSLKPVFERTFDSKISASMSKKREPWKDVSMEVRLKSDKGTLSTVQSVSDRGSKDSEEWKSVSLTIEPDTFKKSTPAGKVVIQATDPGTGELRPAEFEAVPGWYRVNLDGIEPAAPPTVQPPSNDAMEKISLKLSNPTDKEQVARLMFEKTRRGILQKVGTPITGISALLRDRDGQPTGIPVQLSKNWHNDPAGGEYAGQWFHGISQIRLPAKSELELELILAYGHWGGVPAASHAQLSLVGWGSNQLWEQSALGSWGETICYEPDQAQGKCTITDVRPLMVQSMNGGKPWGWTSNVGGGDFFRLFDSDGNRIRHRSMQTSYLRQGPCLTEVTYAGNIGDSIDHSLTVSLARTDDLVRVCYRIRMEVKDPVDFSRLVLFQIGADTYSSTGERKMAIGNEHGVLKEWDTQWGGDTYRTDPVKVEGDIPWASLHEGVPRDPSKEGAIANRGVIIRHWKARLGGKEAAPWMAEHGTDIGAHQSSTLDIVPPRGVASLEPGDFVEATLEHIIVPQFAKDYYGPNKALQKALEEHENTAQMILREATENDRIVEMTRGTLTQRYPDIRITTEENAGEFTLKGGLGFVPVTFTGLSSHAGYQITIDGAVLDQSIHGNDYWQTDYDPVDQSWSRTYNIPSHPGSSRTIRLERSDID